MDSGESTAEHVSYDGFLHPLWTRPKWTVLYLYARDWFGPTGQYG